MGEVAASRPPVDATPPAAAARLVALRLRDLRTYEAADVPLGVGLTVVHGANAAGKTNLLEAAYLACTGRSPRGASDRELVRRGAQAAFAGASVRGPTGEHELAVGVRAGEAHRTTVDGQPVPGLLDRPERPLFGVFLPERLVLVQGAPGVRRAHLDQVLVALRPASAGARRSYSEHLRQRNALLGAVAAGRAHPDDLDPWDEALGVAGAALRAARARVADALGAPVERRAEQLALEGRMGLRYRPQGDAGDDPAALREELRARRAADVERGFTVLGPHRDELVVERDGRALRRFGSQGEQRLAVLALLLGERDAIAEATRRRPVLLLDDVLSELDRERRRRLVDVLLDGGQALLTTTELAHVPGGDHDERLASVAVRSGDAVLERPGAAA